MEEKITMMHGGGGVFMNMLIRGHILPRFDAGRPKPEIPAEHMPDSAVIDGIAFTTDSYTVKPLFFPGGDIGRLSISGTVNDLTVVGAEPLAVSCGLIVEEGLPIRTLDRILESMAEAASEAGVRIATGDLKVVEKGKLDELIINTSGIGVRSSLLDANLESAGRSLESRWLTPLNIKPGDKIIVSGTIGDHAVAVMTAREEMGIRARVESDAAPLNGLMREALKVGGVVAAKDPTRGGLAALLNEWAEVSGVGIMVDEERVPVSEQVRSACDILGIDPMDLANEGKLVLAVAPHMAEEVLQSLRNHPLGKRAEIIGEATKEYEGVVVRTGIGGLRYLPMPAGDPVPRIC